LRRIRRLERPIGNRNPFIRILIEKYKSGESWRRENEALVLLKREYKEFFLFFLICRDVGFELMINDDNV
jgi:hypothetical protein